MNTNIKNESNMNMDTYATTEKDSDRDKYIRHKILETGPGMDIYIDMKVICIETCWGHLLLPFIS